MSAIFASSFFNCVSVEENFVKIVAYSISFVLSFVFKSEFIVCKLFVFSSSILTVEFISMYLEFNSLNCIDETLFVLLSK